MVDQPLFPPYIDKKSYVAMVKPGPVGLAPSLYSDSTDTFYSPTATNQVPAFKDMITQAGLTANLAFVMDAGDSNCYNSGQNLLDTSGNGNHFYLGGSIGVAGDDPTFNGTLGNRSSNEFFSFDGGDYFNAQTFSSWAEWQTTGVGTLIAITRFTGDGTLFGNFQTSFHPGIFIGRFGGSLNINVNYNGGSALVASSGATVPTGVDTFVAVAVDRFGGFNGSLFQIDSTLETFNGAYVASDGVHSDAPYSIGSTNNTFVFMPSGSRLYGLAMWNSKLTSTNIATLRTKWKNRLASLP